MDFPLFFKKWFGLGRVFFWRKTILRKSNTLVYAKALVVTCRKLNCDKCLLRPPKAPLIIGFISENFLWPINIMTFLFFFRHIYILWETLHDPLKVIKRPHKGFDNMSVWKFNFYSSIISLSFIFRSLKKPSLWFCLWMSPASSWQCDSMPICQSGRLTIWQ